MSDKLGHEPVATSLPAVGVRTIDRRGPARTTVVRNLADIDTVREAWSELQASLVHPSPLRSFEYARLWYETFAEPSHVRLFQIADSERVIGILPMTLSNRHGVRVLTGLTNSHCLHAEPLIVPGYEAAFAERLVRELVDHESDWDLVDYEFAYSFERPEPLLHSELLKRFNLRFAQRTEPTFITDLDQDFEQYIAGLSRETRRLFRRTGERLSTLGEPRYVHRQGSDAVAAWQVLVGIEDAGWKGRNGTSIARCDARYRRFYEAFVRLLAEQDALHLFELRINDHPIAAAFGYVDGGTLHYLKAAYDETYHETSPSNNLLREVIRDCMQNYPEIALLHQFPWDSGYKYRFATQETHAYETIAFSPSMRGRVVGALFGLKERLKRIAPLRRAVQRLRGR